MATTRKEFTNKNEALNLIKKSGTVGQVKLWCDDVSTFVNVTKKEAIRVISKTKMELSFDFQTFRCLASVLYVTSV